MSTRETIVCMHALWEAKQPLTKHRGRRAAVRPPLSNVQTQEGLPVASAVEFRLENLFMSRNQ
jgi:hypothetical protein